MGRSKLALAGAIAIACTFPASSARAQSAEDKAAADAAFDQGKRLMIAHSYAEACQKFSESLRRDPGIGTMLGLADCYEKNGQTASAWAQFREAASAAARKSDAREKVARENATRLEPLLSRLVVHVVPKDPEAGAIHVKRDGVEVGRALWDTEVPLDPGVHTVSASAPGKKEWQASITIAPAPGTQTVNVPALEDAPAPIAATSTTTPAADERRDDVDPGRSQRIVALSVGGAGVVMLAVGTIFGLNAKSKLDASNADNHCGPAGDCDPTGLGLRQDAKSAALVSTIGFLVGAAAVTGGAILWLTAPRKDDASEHPRVGIAPSVGAGAAGAVVTGAF